MTNQIPENWLEIIKKRDYEEAIIHEVEEMILALSVHFNINTPTQESVLASIAETWKKPVNEILEILNAFVQFKAKISLLDCFYGEFFHHDEDECLMLTPDVLQAVYGNLDHDELMIIKNAQREMTQAGLYFEWLDIRFEYLS